MDSDGQDNLRNERARRIVDEIDEVADGASIIGRSEDEIRETAAAIIGVTKYGSDPRVVYDWDSLIGCYERRGMEYDEAVEYVEYNVLRALPHLKRPPVIVRRLESAT